MITIISFEIKSNREKIFLNFKKRIPKNNKKSVLWMHRKFSYDLHFPGCFLRKKKKEIRWCSLFCSLLRKATLKRASTSIFQGLQSHRLENVFVTFPRNFSAMNVFINERHESPHLCFFSGKVSLIKRVKKLSRWKFLISIASGRADVLVAMESFVMQK